MNIPQLADRLSDICDNYSVVIQNYLNDCNLEPEVKSALDEISRQTFFALTEYRDAIVLYEQEK